MAFLDEVHAKRHKLAAVLVDEDYSGIRDIVEQLYPDRAHFLFELLQNAEDAGATEAWFELAPDGLTFEHDGRPFDENDVWGITNIGRGTKRDQEDKIGRFGVGFKAVFAYSETPHIYSPTFSFKITDLVLPTALPARPDLGTKTRFEFPFNNTKKKPADAFLEVEHGLRDLAETTLLFLTHLRTVHWRVGMDATGKVLRIHHSAHHVEVLREVNGKTKADSHFLKFEEHVRGLEKQRLAVAFALDFLPNVLAFDAEKPLAKQLKIIPATPGRVAVFFPAEKEVSGLRFHLHAPFVPELSRASIKETPANVPLFEQLADLASAALHRIRDLRLLTAEFLDVLPNKRDQIGDRYDVIRTAIIDAMNDEPLTPTYAKSHAPARNLLQAKSVLKSLISDQDLEFLIDYEETPRQWAVGVAQKNSNADRFLDSLAIETWDVDDFVELLCNKTSAEGNTGSPNNITPESVRDWLREKTVDWHQELYALLLTDHLAASGYRRDIAARTLGSLRIVRLTDGTHGMAHESFFLSDGDDVEHDEGLARVDEGVYTSGKGKAQKENARAFLEQIGVRTVGEAELVEAVLKKRYTREAAVPNEKTYRRDLKRFVELVARQPDAAELFADYYIFQSVDLWRTPDQIFLDQPFLDTGLSAYYDALGESATRVALDPDYLNCGTSVKRLVAFAVAVGACERLEIKPTSCWSNPNARQLVYAAPGSRTRYAIDSDYHIPALDSLLPTTDPGFSRLLWNTLCTQDDDSWTTARYRNNSSYPIRSSPSKLACLLTEQAWIPQTDGQFVRPSEATRDLLPSGFPFDPGWRWLEAIGFGQRVAARSEEESRRRILAQELGFGDDDALDRARRFTALPAEEQQRILAERETRFELPDHEPTNPTRRAERVAAQAATSPERVTEDRTRSVSVNRDAVKQEAGQYLRQQYTNADGQMMCQVCKKRLPFQLDDGTDYFERVEFLPTLKRHHKQNYLALCPNHSAMFQHANGSGAQLREAVAALLGNELAVVLAREPATVYFTKTHLIDLKAALQAEGPEECDVSEAVLEAAGS